MQLSAQQLARAIGHAIAFLMLLPIRAYQYLISPMLPASCRFTPCCSQYAKESIKTHGACYGGFLTLKRLLRCHPFGGSGFDPVPEKTCNATDYTHNLSGKKAK